MIFTLAICGNGTFIFYNFLFLVHRSIDFCFYISYPPCIGLNCFIGCSFSICKQIINKLYGCLQTTTITKNVSGSIIFMSVSFIYLSQVSTKTSKIPLNTCINWHLCFFPDINGTFQTILPLIMMFVQGFQQITLINLMKFESEPDVKMISF